jgi:hypothetical protein
MSLEGASTCTLCHAPIVWRLTVGNRRFRLEPEPAEGGNVVVVTLPDGTVRAKVLTGPEMPAQQEAYRIHACARPERVVRRCGVCWQPLPAELVAVEDWRCHPCCEPGYRREVGRQAAVREAA